MIEIESDDPNEARLPDAWLPAASPAPDAASWIVQRERILATAAPALHALRGTDDGPWIDTIASWWTRAAAGVAAAATILIAVRQIAAPAPPSRPATPFDLISAAGEPAAVWRAYGIEADPVLAVIANETTAR